MEKAEEYVKEREEKKDDSNSSFIQSKRELLPEFNIDAQDPEKIYSFFSSKSSSNFEIL